MLKNKEGDKYVDLGKRKHATVRTFKGMTLLDIREFYDAGGEEKPGKKGISLAVEQVSYHNWVIILTAHDRKVGGTEGQRGYHRYIVF